MNACNNCVLRLFNDKGHNLHGIGNKWSGNAIILSNVDYDAYKKQDMSFSSQVEIINEIISTGGVEQNLYITPLIRCSEHFDVEITRQVVSNCYTYFEKDISKYQIRNIMLCGDSAKRLLGIDNLASYLNTIICDTKAKRCYFINYSPLVKYTNNNLYMVFKKQLIKYYNSIIDRVYDYELNII